MKHRTNRIFLLFVVVPFALGIQFLCIGGGRSAGASAVASCPDDAGRGGVTSAILSGTRGGNGCVVFEIGGDLTTFVFTGALQTWVAPSNVNSVKVHLIGAGGGGGRSGTSAYGGGGGYATGLLNVTPGQTFDVIVGGGGIRQCTGDVPPLADDSGRRNFSYGGGASGNGSASYDCSFAAGGGRSALRLAGGSADIVTAGGGGGGGYTGAGGAGGGLVGAAGGGTGGAGGTQSAGGATASPEPGVAGIQYAGGWAGFSNSLDNAGSEAGGGGGGYYGGGAGGDNGGGGGGSSYVGALTAASTTAGSGREAGIDPPTVASSPAVPARVDIGATATVAGGSWTHGGISTYKWQQSSDGVTFTDIVGAVGASYVPEAAGYIRVVETRTNFLGSTIAISNTAAIADTTLSGLSLSSGVLSPSFRSSVRSYVVAVPFRTRSIKISPVPTDVGATVAVNGSAVVGGSSSGDIDLSVGNNSIAVVVTVGGSSTTTTVLVQRAAAAVPSGPIIDDVVVGDAAVTLLFSAPTDDGGDDVTSYEYSLDGQSWVPVVGDRRFVISGLTNGTAVSVELRAVNSAGAGAKSAARTVTPLAPTTSTSTSTTTTSTSTTTTTTTTTTSGPSTTTTTFSAETTRAATRRASSTTQSFADASTTTIEEEQVSGSTSTSSSSVPVIEAPTTTSSAGESNISTTTAPVPGKKLTLVPHIKSGQLAAGSDIEAKAEGLAPNTRVVLELHSTVRLLGEQTTSADGSTSFDEQLPNDIEAGTHMLVLRGTAPDGSPLVAVAPFTVGPAGVIEKVLPVSIGSTVPDATKLSRMIASGAKPYDPVTDFSGVAALATAAVVVMGVAGGSGSKSSSDDSGDGQGTSGEPQQGDDAVARDETSESSLSSADAKYFDTVGFDRESWGDRSRLWRTPGWRIVHSLLGRLAGFFDNKSTLVVRLLQDGTWVRAAFGPLGVVPWIAGAILGICSAMSVDAMALPPSLGFVAAIVSLAFVDALAGAVAWITFVVVVCANGNFGSWFDLRTLLGLGVLFACVPVIGAAIRPVLRSMDGGRDDVVQRIGDYIMMPIFLGYAASSVYAALNGLSGLNVVSSSAAETLRNVCFAAAIARLLVEDVSSRGFPHRRAEAAMKVERGTGVAIAYLNVVLLWAVFLLTAVPYFGLGWSTWTVVTVMSLVPLAKIHKAAFPNFELIHRWFPRGILRATIMLFLGAYYSRWIQGVAGNAVDARALAPFLLLPGVAIGLIDCFGRSGGSWPESKSKQAAGFALWLVTLAVLLGWVTP